MNGSTISMYKRDGRSPVPKLEITSRVMRGNRGKNTCPELTLRKALREAGLPGYRLHWNKAPGRPDISYPGRRIAIFVNGCYWHRCPKCKMSLPKSHSEFWRIKFDRNVKRDREKAKALTSNGWQVLIIWECEIDGDIALCIARVRRILEGKMI